jgi:hypothetical protein
VYLAISFVQRGAIGSTVVLEYMVPFKTESVFCLPGEFADSLHWKLVSYRAVQVSISSGFMSACVWWVWIFPDACSSLCVVLCVALLLVRVQTH